MSYTYDNIPIINNWLDTMNTNKLNPELDHAMRIFKLVEELGEAAQAYIGVIGQNPRKDVTHLMNDVLNELADVVVTTLCVIQHFTQDGEETRRVVEFKIGQIIARSPEIMELLNEKDIT